MVHVSGSSIVAARQSALISVGMAHDVGQSGPRFRSTASRPGALDIKLEDCGVMDEAIDRGERHCGITVHCRAPQSSIGWCPMSRLLTCDIPCLAASLRCCRSARDEV